MVGDVVIRYSRYGKGDITTVLLHGYGASLEVWESFGGQLGKSRDILVLDLPGSGISTDGGRERLDMSFMASVTSQLISDLGIESYELVGHSMGGAVAVALLEIDGAKVREITLLHSLPMGSSIKGKESTQREIALLEAGKREMLAMTNPSKGFAPQNLKKCEDAIEEKIEQFMMSEETSLIATLKGLLACEDRSGVLKNYKGRVTFVFGEFDPYISSDKWDLIRSEFNGARIEIFENSAHHCFIEEQERTLSLF